MTKKYLTTKELAERSGFSVGTLRVWRSQYNTNGVLKGPPFVSTASGDIRYDLKDVMAWEKSYFKKNNESK